MKSSVTSREAVPKLCVASGHGRKTAKVRESQGREGRVHVGMVCVRECECCVCALVQ
jgi:hypothetical protein